MSERSWRGLRRPKIVSNVVVREHLLRELHIPARPNLLIESPNESLVRFRIHCRDDPKGGVVEATVPGLGECSVQRPFEMRMGSPQYGRLILDGEALSGSQEIEASSLVWSEDGDRLAAQELVDWVDGPATQVAVFDTERRRKNRGITSATRDRELDRVRARRGAVVPPLESADRGTGAAPQARQRVGGRVGQRSGMTPELISLLLVHGAGSGQWRSIDGAVPPCGVTVTLGFDASRQRSRPHPAG